MPNRKIIDYDAITSTLGTDLILLQRGDFYKYITVDDYNASLASNTLANGKILVGNASNEATAVTMSGDVTITNAGVTTVSIGINQLTDATITSASNNQILRYNGVEWVNASISTVAYTGAYSDLTGKPTIPSTLDDLSDVTISGATSNQVLQYNGSTWVNATLSSATTIYSGNGNLASNRTITMNGKSFTFEESAATQTITISNLQASSKSQIQFMVNGDSAYIYLDKTANEFMLKSPSTSDLVLYAQGTTQIKFYTGNPTLLRAYITNAGDLYCSYKLNVTGDIDAGANLNVNGGDVTVDGDIKTINTGIYYCQGSSGFTGTGVYTTFTIKGGIITNAS